MILQSLPVTISKIKKSNIHSILVNFCTQLLFLSASNLTFLQKLFTFAYGDIFIRPVWINAREIADKRGPSAISWFEFLRCCRYMCVFVCVCERSQQNERTDDIGMWKSGAAHTPHRSLSPFIFAQGKGDYVLILSSPPLSATHTYADERSPVPSPRWKFIMHARAKGNNISPVQLPADERTMDHARCRKQKSEYRLSSRHFHLLPRGSVERSSLRLRGLVLDWKMINGLGIASSRCDGIHPAFDFGDGKSIFNINSKNDGLLCILLIELCLLYLCWIKI